MLLEKLDQFCKSLISLSKKLTKKETIKETKKETVKKGKRKSTKKKVVKLTVTFKSECIETVTVDGKLYEVKLTEFENGQWQYQLNTKYDKDFDGTDLWFPTVDSEEFNTSLFNSKLDAKLNAEADIRNQRTWGKIL